MGVSFSQRDQVVGRLPTHITEEEGNSAIISRAHPVPHAEEGGSHSPTGGILVPFPEFPQDLIHRGPSTTGEQHDCAALQLEEEEREEEQHHLMKSTHPSLFQRDNAIKRQTDLRS